MRKRCVAGSRTFSEYVIMEKVLDALLSTIPEPVTIISGGAHGADTLAERYAKEHGIPLEVYPANWKIDWKRAGFIRNTQMACIADELVAFWDGQSHGTAHMIEEMTKRGKPVTVFDIHGERLR